MSQNSSPIQTPEPIPAGQPLPHRKVIRSWMIPISARRTPLAVFLLLLDWVIFAALMVGTVLLTPWWAKLLCGLAAGFWIGRLFIIGHDACHQSYTPHRKLNRLLGRIALLPSLTPYSLWEVGHNVVHHGYTNLKGVDFVWAPLTKAEYEALSPSRRVLERIYRSGWGPALYYLIEMWWLRMFFPRKTYMGTQRKEFIWDGLFVSVSAALWIAALVAAAYASGQSVWVLLGFGFVLPFLFWNAMIGFVVYVHHTHTAVQWHDDKAVWAKAAPFVSTTVHLTFPLRIGGLLHHIMEHTAHHVDMSIPLYKLKSAQKLLEDTLPGRIIVQKFSWRWYFDTARKCKLYDFTRRCWTDFQGRPTSDCKPAAA
ncbi:fatty acid desaturase [Hydrogenophaga sp.]|uniref:fatty acid desaturase n=1 Tax=Hydrogenophaga sp. TaxID=1904254 RepID=UPI0019AC7C17|nr:fatty acid desaturase [Hydrogenophaga sp.]MBD3892344.1 fatty acid desaturase [Hydrogenophaga sp.]